MSDMTDDEYIQAIIKAREESVRFFSSASKDALIYSPSAAS